MVCRGDRVAARVHGGICFLGETSLVLSQPAGMGRGLSVLAVLRVHVMSRGLSPPGRQSFPSYQTHLKSTTQGRETP